MKRGEVWWLEFEPAAGGEIRKKRLAVVVSNDFSNKHMSRVQVLPLSSNVGRIYPSETVVTLSGQKNKVMADQIMTADKRQLKEMIGNLNQADMRAVAAAIQTQLGIEP